MSVTESKLTPNQERAIIALLNSPTIGEAAEAIRITDRTLFRWLQTDDFRSAYKAARREAISQAVTQLQASASIAVQTLKDVAADSNAKDSARVSAARAILDLTIRVIEYEDLEARIAELEARYA